MWLGKGLKLKFGGGDTGNQVIFINPVCQLFILRFPEEAEVSQDVELAHHQLLQRVVQLPVTCTVKHESSLSDILSSVGRGRMCMCTRAVCIQYIHVSKHMYVLFMGVKLGGK